MKENETELKEIKKMVENQPLLSGNISIDFYTDRLNAELGEIFTVAICNVTMSTLADMNFIGTTHSFGYTVIYRKSTNECSIQSSRCTGGYTYAMPEKQVNILESDIAVAGMLKAFLFELIKQKIGKRTEYEFDKEMITDNPCTIFRWIFNTDTFELKIKPV